MNTIKLSSLLVIEDCPFTCKGYKSIIEQDLNTPPQITFTSNCDEAVRCIKTKTFELVLLDLQLPASKNGKYINGDDLGPLIRNTDKHTKVIVITNISAPLRINNVIHKINPEGFLIKANVNPRDLIKAIGLVLQGSKYYCEAIKGHTQNTFKNITIDDIDRQILYHLSMGVKTKDISNFIPLSHRTIEVRKSKLKDLLAPKNSKDFNLVKEAKLRKII